MRKLFAGLAILALGASSMFAGTIEDIGLFNTGVNASRVAYTTSGPDTHYVYNSTSTPVVTLGIPCDPGPYPSCGGTYSWIATSTVSAWIAPQTNVGNMPAPGPNDIVYSYTTTFDLTGYDLSTVVITGRWAADNWGDILLNSLTTPVASIAAGGSATAYNTFTGAGHAFTIDNSGKGLIQGPNTVTFKTTNQYVKGYEKSNPTGLRVEFLSATGSLEQQEVIPEPGTLALLGGGLLAIGLFRRRR